MNAAEYNDTTFEKMVDEFLDERWKYNPTEATLEGIHDYDGELNQVDEETIRGFLRKEEELLGKLDNFKKSDRLSPDRRLDLEILSDQLRKDIVSDKKFNRFRRDPSVYVDIAVFSCLALLLRDFAPVEERYLSLIRRLKRALSIADQTIEGNPKAIDARDGKSSDRRFDSIRLA